MEPIFREIRSVVTATRLKLIGVVETLNDLEQYSNEITQDYEKRKKAEQWIINRMPIFSYFDEYPILDGHQNIDEYISRKHESNLTRIDENFEKICKVAELDPAILQENINNTGVRHQHVTHAGTIITKEIQKWWKDSDLKIRFGMDGNHINIYVSDPDAAHGNDIHFDERSRGFKWFFSFFIMLAADTKEGVAKDTILLLDEPGLYLHAKSQKDLLDFFDNKIPNQIIFTTHSPFMVPIHRIDCVRTANKFPKKGTKISNNPTGNYHTLFPLQAALGYNIAQSLFLGYKNLVVEGVTDFWILSSMSEYLNAKDGSGLSEIAITPAGGAQRIITIVSILFSESQKIIALLDKEKEAQRTRDELINSKFINEKDVVFVTEAFESEPPREADIEDLIDPEIYEEIVNQCYKKELANIKLNINQHIPRISKRFDKAFADNNIKFDKTKIAHKFMEKIGTDPQNAITGEMIVRFRRLFFIINKRI